MVEKIEGAGKIVDLLFEQGVGYEGPKIGDVLIYRDPYEQENCTICGVTEKVTHKQSDEDGKWVTYYGTSEDVVRNTNGWEQEGDMFGVSIEVYEKVKGEYPELFV